MSTQIAKTETAAQIANAQNQANAITSSFTLTAPKNTFVLSVVFKCTGIGGHSSSASGEDNVLMGDDYILSIKAASAHQDARVDSTITVNLDL